MPTSAISVLNAVAQVAVCTPNHPICATNTTKLVRREEPLSPKAFVAHIAEGSPKSVACIPVRTITKLQIKNPINAAKTILDNVIDTENSPPTSSIGIQIIVPIHKKAMLIQLWRSASETRLIARLSIFELFLLS